MHRSLSFSHLLCMLPILLWKSIQGGQEDKEDKGDVISYLSLLTSLWLSLSFPACLSDTWCLWGVSVVFIVRWRGGEGEGELMMLRSQLHGNSRHGHAFGEGYILRWV